MKKHLLLFALLLLISGEMLAQQDADTINIEVNANPTNGGTVTGGGTFHAGATCTLIATANQGYNFDHWTKNGNYESESDTLKFTVTIDATYTAYFQPKPYTINFNVEPENGGTVMIDGIETDSVTYDYGTSFSFEAHSNDGYAFDHWQDGNTDNPRTITVTGDSTFTAYFSEIPVTYYTINTAVIPEGTGEVTGGGTFPADTTILLTPVAYSGYTFDHWQDDSTDNPRTITVTGDSTFTAYFSKIPVSYYTINTDVIPEEAGTVIGGGTFPADTTITLSAQANAGYTFDHWQDDSTDNPRTITVTGDSTFTAYFSKIPVSYYTINTEVIPEEAGTVIGGGTFPADTIIILTAEANIGYTFDHWQDNSTDNPRTITVTGDSTFTAYFSEISISYYTINTEVIPEGTGEVTGGGTFPADTTILLTPVAYSGYSFDHWQDGNTDNPREITVTENATYIAHFSEIPVTYYTINTAVIPEGTGEVTGGGTFPADTTILLTPVAYSGYSFDHWQDGNTDNPREITVTEDATYIAHFEKIHCIDDLQTIQPKYHTEDNDRYIMILVYPNPNDEDFEYQWLYSNDGINYNNLTEGTYNKQYYYKGGRLKEGYYKVRVSKNGCSDETEAFPVEHGSHLRIYPNPSHRGNEIIIMNDCDGPALLTIYSIDGRLLHTQTVTDKQATISINLPQGVYVAYLTDSDGYTKVCKLIIQ